MRLFQEALPLVLVSMLVACAAPKGIVPVQSTLSAVRASLGSPTDIRFDQNGDELWEYASGPMGTETYLIRAGQDSRVKSVTQLLTEAQFATVVPDRTTKAEVRYLLGRPTDQVFLSNGTSWSWHVALKPQLGHFVVRFDSNDVVVEKFVVIDAGSGDSEGDRGDAG